jgi:hypothetical protein
MNTKNTEDIFNFSSNEIPANAYKFKVEMVIGIFAENDSQASEQIDLNGGFIISRKVELLDKKNIHEIEKNEKK